MAATIHVFHHQEQVVVGLHDVERRDHVRVADARNQARLVEEHRDEIRVLREVSVELLDRDRPREAFRSDEAPDVDGGHPARRDLPVERIPSDDPLGSRQSDGLVRHVPT